MKSFAIIGCGRFGSSVAMTLSELGNEVLAVDADHEKVNAIVDHVTTALQVDILDEGVIDVLGLRNFDVAVISIGSNLEASVMATLLAVEANVPLVVAKAKSSRQGRLLEKVGAHKIIYPERDMGVRLAYNLSSNAIIDYLDISDDFSIAEFHIHDQWVNHTLTQLDLRQKYQVNVIAIRRGPHMIIDNLQDVILQNGDVLVFLGNNCQINKLESIYGKNYRKQY